MRSDREAQVPPTPQEPPAGGLATETPRRRHGPAPLKRKDGQEMEEGKERLPSRQPRLSPGGPWGWGHRRARRQNHGAAEHRGLDPQT